MNYEQFDSQAMNIIIQLNQLQLAVANYHAMSKNKSLDVIGFLKAVDNLRSQLIYIVEE